MSTSNLHDKIVADIAAALAHLHARGEQAKANVQLHIDKKGPP